MILGNKSLIRRHTSLIGLFILCASTSIGVVGSTTSWASGVTAYNDAQSIANDDFSYGHDFSASVQTAIITLRTSDPSTADVATRFYDSYSKATGEYTVALSSAVDTYPQASSTNNAKADYLADFDAAKSDYFNKLTSARSTLISELIGVGGRAKITFLESFDEACASFDNGINTERSALVAL